MPMGKRWPQAVRERAIELYKEQNLFDSEIAKLTGVHPRTIWAWLKPYKEGKPDRRINTSAQKAFTSIQKQVLTGSLLGDGTLRKPKGGSKSVGYEVTRKLSDEEYLTWNREIFAAFMNYDTNKYRTMKASKLVDTPCEAVYFSTRHDPLFGEERARWYPKNKKRVPKDIKLTPLTVAVWLCDDGCISFDSHEKNSIQTTFATLGFPKADVVRLVNLLNKLTGAEFRLEHNKPKNGRKGGYNIVGSVNATKALVKVIGPVMPPGMERKLTAYKIVVDKDTPIYTNGGEHQWNAKLNPRKVKRIRRLLAEGKSTPRKLADYYGINIHHIYYIRDYKVWKNV